LFNVDFEYIFRNAQRTKAAANRSIKKQFAIANPELINTTQSSNSSVPLAFADAFDEPEHADYSDDDDTGVCVDFEPVSSSADSNVLTDNGRDKWEEMGPPLPDIESGFERSAAAVLEQLEVDGLELSYEEICKQRLDQHLQRTGTCTQEISLHQRVQQWQDRICPILEEEERRTQFDIHLTADKLVSRMAVHKQNVRYHIFFSACKLSMNPEPSKSCFILD
jgi:hypothetical protein